MPGGVYLQEADHKNLKRGTHQNGPKSSKITQKLSKVIQNYPEMAEWSQNGPIALE